VLGSVVYTNVESLVCELRWVSGGRALVNRYLVVSTAVSGHS